MDKRPWNYSKVELICIVCGNKFLVSRAHANKRKTCSLKCHWETKKKFPINGMKICNTCKKLFPADMQHFFKDIKTACGLARNCKACHTKRSRQWGKDNPERLKIRSRNYMRKHRIGQNGKDIRNPIGKRAYPSDECCEVCKEKVRLVYHHWDNSDFSKGMWICTKCHVAGHWLEKHDQRIFLDLKVDIEQGVAKKLRYWEETT